MAVQGRSVGHVYSPVYRGGLFSMKAAIPSCRSRVGMTWKERSHKQVQPIQGF